jgi:hypothetical protein
MTTSRRIRLAALCLVAVLPLVSGCGSVAIQRPYTTDELARICSRGGGVWRPHVADGYCEYQSPGFM